MFTFIIIITITIITPTGCDNDDDPMADLHDHDANGMMIMQIRSIHALFAMQIRDDRDQCCP